MPPLPPLLLHQCSDCHCTTSLHPLYLHHYSLTTATAVAPPVFCLSLHHLTPPALPPPQFSHHCHYHCVVTGALLTAPSPLAVCSVFSRNLKRANELGRQISAGMTVVNDFAVNYMVQSLPFGGVRISGFDRFAGPEGLRALCMQKSVVTDMYVPGAVPRVVCASPRPLSKPRPVSVVTFEAGASCRGCCLRWSRSRLRRCCAVQHPWHAHAGARRHLVPRDTQGCPVRWRFGRHAVRYESRGPDQGPLLTPAGGHRTGSLRKVRVSSRRECTALFYPRHVH
jgi:hypothetical protein